MVKNNKWVAWVAIIALVVAVLALVLILSFGITGDAIKLKSSSAKVLDKDCYSRCISEKCSASKLTVVCKIKNNALCSNQCTSAGIQANSSCPSLSCTLYCPNGYQNDSRGCSICKCAQSCVPSWTDEFKFETPTNKLNLGEGLLDITTSLIGKNNLPHTLKNGLYRDINNNIFNYTQVIRVGNLTLTNFSDVDYNNRQWTIGSKIISNQFILNYTLDFVNQPLFSNLNGTQIELLGNQYTIVSAKIQYPAKIILRNSHGDKIELTSGSEVKLNDRIISGLNVILLNYGTSSLYKINLEWKADDKMFLTQENNLVVPAFNNVYFRFDGMTHTPAEDYGNLYLVGKDNSC